MEEEAEDGGAHPALGFDGTDHGAAHDGLERRARLAVVRRCHGQRRRVVAGGGGGGDHRQDERKEKATTPGSSRSRRCCSHGDHKFTIKLITVYLSDHSIYSLASSCLGRLLVRAEGFEVLHYL